MLSFTHDLGFSSCEQTHQLPSEDSLSVLEQKAHVLGVTESLPGAEQFTLVAQTPSLHTTGNVQHYEGEWTLRSSACWFCPSPVDEKKFWAAGALLNSFKGWSKTVEQIALGSEICPLLDQEYPNSSCVFCFSFIVLRLKPRRKRFW